MPYTQYYANTRLAGPGIPLNTPASTPLTQWMAANPGQGAWVDPATGKISATQSAVLAPGSALPGGGTVPQPANAGIDVGANMASLMDAYNARMASNAASESDPSNWVGGNYIGGFAPLPGGTEAAPTYTPAQQSAGSAAEQAPGSGWSANAGGPAGSPVVPAAPSATKLQPQANNSAILSQLIGLLGGQSGLQQLLQLVSGGS